MPYVPPGNDFPPSQYGALGPARGAIAPMIGAANRQAQPKLSHVKVPISTLIGLLMADAVKPVAHARRRPTPGGMMRRGPVHNVITPRPRPTVASLSKGFGGGGYNIGSPGNWF